jgi:ABC-type sugar transport system ATPase subunit
MSEICLETIGLTKQYPGVLALDAVNYKVYKGKINSLIGENGAGKSTLMKIISGNIQPSEGKMVLEGTEVVFNNVNDASLNGIGIIHQELNLFDNLTVAENIFIGKEIHKNKINLDRKMQNEKAWELLKRLKFPIDPTQIVGSLKVGEKQIVEIAKAIAQNDLKILIMDEPTSSLSNTEVEILFKVIADLVSEGLTIIYISHRLEEILRISDCITVLRDGKLIVDVSDVKTNTPPIDLPWIIEKMIGHSQKYDYHQLNKQIGNPILKLNNLSLFDSKKGYQLNDISFELNEHEILGIYGFLGSGRTELLESIIGLNPKIDGQILFHGKDVTGNSISEQIKLGIYLVPEERQKQSIVQKLSIANNLVLSSLSKMARGMTVIKRKLISFADQIIVKLNIKVSNKNDRITSLSGGNQQKVIIGRGLLTEPTVLLLDEPTKGVDVGAKHELFEIISDLALNSNLSIILVSSEIEEIISIADRVLVLSNGFIADEFTASEINEKNLMIASSKYLGDKNGSNA